MVDLSDEDFEAAARRGMEMADDALAASARYEPKTRSLSVGLRNGASFSFPVDKVQGLADAADRDLAEVEITGNGYGLHWERLDVDFTVAGLAAGIFGTAKYMARQAGRTTSAAKATAARVNGTRGGRPRKAAG